MYHRIINNLRDKFAIYIIVMLEILLGIVISNNFLTPRNLFNVIDNISLLGIVAGGLALVTYSGNFSDLTVPSVMALSGLIAIKLLKYGLAVSVICAILIAFLIGVINAVVVGKLKAHPVVWTLALSFMITGFIRVIFGSTHIYPESGTLAGNAFVHLYRTKLLGFMPLSMVFMFVILIIMHFIISKTVFGQQLKFVAVSPPCANLTGINVPKIIGFTFIISSLTASIAGIFIASLSETGAYYYGKGYDFSALTAIILGGITLEGGKGNIVGVFGGVLALGFLSNILTLLGMSTFSQDVIKGIVFITVVWITNYSTKKKEWKIHA